ncbi:MAG: hypothetical protein P8Z37_16965 [Acidobacteriota bacterium]
MKSAYHLLKGKDVLQSLQFDSRDLRLQCDRELKGDLLHLRQRFINTQGKKKELTALVRESVVAFTAIFRALLHLKGSSVPTKKEDVLLQTCKEFNMDAGLFSRLISVRKGAEKPELDALQGLVDGYIRQIRSLSQYVDAMQL